MNNTKSPCMLYADKWEEINDFTKDYLTQKGFTCFTTDSVKEMFKILENEPIDIVIAKLGNYPEGCFHYDSLERIEKDERDVAVIVTTSGGGGSHHMELLSRGVVDVLLRPFSLGMLELSISTALKRRAVKLKVAELLREVKRLGGEPDTIEEQETEPKILILSYEPDVGDIFEEFLKQKGYKTCTSDNDAEVIEILKQKDIDILISDIPSSGIDGIDAFHKNKEELDVILLLGNPAKTGRFISENISDYLLKPVPLSTLDVKLASVLKFRQIKKQIDRLEKQLRILKDS